MGVLVTARTMDKANEMIQRVSESVQQIPTQCKDAWEEVALTCRFVAALLKWQCLMC